MACTFIGVLYYKNCPPNSVQVLIGMTVIAPILSRHGNKKHSCPLCLRTSKWPCTHLAMHKNIPTTWMEYFVVEMHGHMVPDSVPRRGSTRSFPRISLSDNRWTCTFFTSAFDVAMSVEKLCFHFRDNEDERCKMEIEKFLGAMYCAEHDTPFDVLCPKELSAYQSQLAHLSHSAVSEKMRWLQCGARAAMSTLIDSDDDEQEENDEDELRPLKDQ